MRTILLLLALSAGMNTFAARVFNNGIIKGTLKDEKGEPLPFTTLFLKNSSDSTLYKGELSAEDGRFLFEHIREGSYYLEVKAVGMSQYRSVTLIISESKPETDLGTITLNPAATDLHAVTITAYRPFIERQVDRTVVNVENSVVFAGASVMDMMEKLPAVQVNQDGIISLKGKQGVIIMIDGKPTQMSGQDLANMLRGMSSASIQKIEIITNPSAKYDAAGNAGIINIVMKKNKKEGLNGSLTGGYGQGRYEKYNGGFTIGYKNAKYNLFANYN
jgi:hypothetical protein